MRRSGGQRSDRRRLGGPLRSLVAASVAITITVVLGSLLLAGTAAASEPAPSIESESVSHVTQTGARLEAQINPESSEHWDHAQFQLVKNPSEFLSTFACPTEWKNSSLCIGTDHEAEGLPMRYVSAGLQGESVGLDVTLQPDTTYHYRIIAARGVQEEDTFGYEPPIVYGPDQTLTTPTTGGEPEAPTVTSCPGPIIDGGGFKVCGILNPHSDAKVGYYFAYKAGASCKEGYETPLQAEAEVQDKEVSAELFGLEADTQYTLCLVATNEHGETFSPAVSFTTEPGRPSIKSVSASHVTQHSATLEATINPEGAQTSYEIWFLPGCTEGGCERLPARVVAKASDIGKGNENVDVEAQLTELEPGVSNNEYWVVASSAFGTIESAHQTFATLSAPSIENESVSHLTQSDATLEATINPEDARSAYYQFQLVANPSEYLSTFACPSGQAHTILCELSELDNEVEGLPLGKVAGFENQTVSLDLASAGVTLQPGTTYHYRVITAREAPHEEGPAWEKPIVAGSDQTFTTPSRARPLGGEPEPTGGGTQSGSSSTSGQSGSSGTLGGKPPGSPGKTVTAKVLTRGQKLAKALKQCKKEPKRKQAACKKQAHKKYAPVKKKSKKK